ncbi:MAG: EAL domain-containing protein [Pseudomonadota bacterium]|nr:EAL domain-containing protein [Pseudomonadota bacterium]
MTDLANIAQWRMRIFTSLMLTLRVLALVGVLPSAALAIYRGLPVVGLMDAVALAWILAICRMDKLPYNVRAFNYLALLFGAAICTMMTVGTLGLMYLLAAPVMSVILVGLRAGLGMLALSACSIIVLGLTGYSHFPIENGDPNSFATVFIFTLNYAGIGAFITLTCGKLLKGLSASLDEQRLVAETLAERQSSLHALNDNLRLTSAALAGLNDMVLIAKVKEEAGAQYPVIFANKAFERRSGYHADEIVGRSLRMLHGPDTDAAIVRRMAEAMARREPVAVELVQYTKFGEPCWIEVEMVPFANESRDVTHWVAVGRDITERRRSADAIHQLAFFDVLTGLPNRRLLMERLDQMVVRTHAGDGCGAVLYIDLDNFKHINDARGHATGDAVLRHIAGCLSRAVHRKDTVARLGGDEFVVLAEHLDCGTGSATDAALALGKIVCKAMTEEVLIDGQLYRLSGSIGIALPTRPGHTVPDLLREADTAMYHAKGAGRNGVALFEPTMLAEAENILILERDLANAILNDELALHLQLQVDHDGIAIGAEALLRWRRADGVLVPPDVFIPVAEASGHIVTLGAWVLREACHAWCELDKVGHALPLSINISPRQFREPNFVSEVKTIISAAGVPPQQLIFEVTEGLLVDDLDLTIARMGELAHFGIRFSIDDFGTGYSNLAYLQRMPLYELKIDKSFMRDMPHDINGTAIVQSILAMAGHLNLRVVAEGIETTEQARFLTEHGSPYMQGYLFCRPMALSDLIERMTASSHADAKLEVLFVDAEAKLTGR